MSFEAKASLVYSRQVPSYVSFLSDPSPSFGRLNQPQLIPIPDSHWPPKNDRWKADLKLRIVQHNIRTVASYYKQINTKRLAELLGLEEAQAERNVAGTPHPAYSSFDIRFENVL